MEVNFLDHFSKLAMRDKDIPFLAGLDYLISTERIRRQETAEALRTAERIRVFENQVESALQQLGGSAGLVDKS